jgi:hypothetical protein
MATTLPTPSDADIRSELAATVAERVEVALAVPATRAALAAKGISVEEARSFLTTRTMRVALAEAGLR